MSDKLPFQTASSEPESLRQFDAMMSANAPIVQTPTMIAMQKAYQIYKDLKWQIKAQGETDEQIAGLIRAAIDRCKAEIVVAEVQAMTVAKFERMIEILASGQAGPSQPE